jgi:hypothetical protein
LPTRFDKFAIGFISSAFVPLIKIVQGDNPVLSNPIDWVYIIGSIIPIFLLCLLTGIYALTVEKDETDLKRLFRTCLAIPALIMTLGTGYGDNQAVADSHEVVCETKHAMHQGFLDTFDKFRNAKRVRYYLLSEHRKTPEYIRHSGKRYYIVVKTSHKPAHGIVFDAKKCKILKLIADR